MPLSLKHDYTLDIATGQSRMSKKWRNKSLRWSELVERCSQTHRTHETAAQYAAMSREEQSRIKDVGGFVGGFLSGGVRKKGSVLFRSLATLDIDYGTPDVWDDFTLAHSCAAMIYSTHRHSERTPRYRLVLPLSRQVDQHEYEPLCRKLAASVGIDLFDDTTYELPRLFYWPSTSADAPYFFDYQDGPALDVDALLGEYVDYRDASSWPLSSREGDIVRSEILKAGDPTEKPGVIGAFCRSYTIEEAIETLLADHYTPTETTGRYTYRLGSVAGGLVCYDGRWAYSHHQTDPTSRQLCNAFDLCRLHLYGSRDEGSRVQDVTRLPSYLAMQELARCDKRVKLTLHRERMQAAAADFEGIDPDPTDPTPNPATEDTNPDWLAGLDLAKSGRPNSTIANALLILENDPALRGRIRHNLFTGLDEVTAPLPWRDTAGQWTDSDDANLRTWLEDTHGYTGKEKISDALAALLTRNSYHPIRDYLNALQWDGTPRLERIVIDYLGAEDNELNRTMARKHFTAAVARIMSPGCKYDYCLVLTGPEGAGKSTLLGVMGGAWFNDSITTTEGKEGMEQLRQAWIVELGELSSVKRSTVEQVKAFLSKRSDIYRAAYGRRITEYPRQCVFCGTTNETHFLKGDTGNRRFWVVRIDPTLRKHNDWRAAIVRDRDQLWAEAMHHYRAGEPLYLSADLETKAKQVQAEHNDDADEPLEPLLRAYLDTRLPPDWDTLTIQQRRQYLTDPDPLSATATVRRTRVCAAEFLCERMGRDMTDKEYKYMARRVTRILDNLEGWERVSTSRHVEKLYGIQKAFERVNQEGNEDTL